MNYPTQQFFIPQQQFPAFFVPPQSCFQKPVNAPAKPAPKGSIFAKTKVATKVTAAGNQSILKAHSDTKSRE